MISFNNLSMQFLVNGNEWPLMLPQLNYIKIQRAVNLALPIIEINFDDRIEFFRNNNVVCGSELIFGFKVEDKEYAYNFFIADIESSHNKENTTKLVGLLNKPKWLRGVAKAHFGSSLEVISQIANECNYKFVSSVKQTNDTKVWLGNLTNYGMASEISTKGYIDDNSCMLLATGLEAVIYENIFEEPNWDTAKVFTDQVQSKNDIQIYNSLLKKGKATSQLLYTYPVELISQGIKNNIINKTSFKKVYSEVIPTNQIFKENIGFARRELYPFDIGNTFENEYKAYFNNLKRKAQFQDIVCVYANGFPKVSLLEQVITNYNKNTSYGIVSSIITTISAESKSVSSRIDISTTNANVKE